MKKSLIYLQTLVAFLIVIYASCSKNSETITQAGLSPTYQLQLPAHRMGVFYFDGNLGIIGYKICGFAGMCLHTKTIEVEKTGSGLDQNMSSAVYNRIMQK